jgi:hypothetical protein
VLMVAGALTWLSVPIALFIGTIGAVSVFKAVYIDKRELKCACVGGSSNVPLGFVSLTENLMMIAMAVWMAGAELPSWSQPSLWPCLSQPRRAKSRQCFMGPPAKRPLAAHLGYAWQVGRLGKRFPCWLPES